MHNVILFYNKFMKLNKAFLIITIVLIHAAVYAQQPPQSQIDKAAKEADRPIEQEAGKKLLPPSEREPQVKKEEKEARPAGPTFVAKRIVLTGNESIPLEEFKPLTDKYLGQTTDLQGLNKLAKKIEKEYLVRGIIAACFVPPQEIKDGIVKLQIVEARMGELEIKDHRFFNKRMLPLYWQMKPGEILRYDKLSRSLQHMNKNPDREAKATLHAGKKPGTTDVLLDVDSYFPAHFLYSFDTEGSTFTGTNRTGYGMRHNNLLGLDDTLLAGYSFGSNFDGVYAYHRLPITGYGTSVLYGFSHTIARPKKDYERFELKSTADNSTFFIYQDLFKKDKYVGTFRFGLDAKDKTVRLRDRTINRDALRVMRLGGNFMCRGQGHVTTITPEFSQGLNILGAKINNPYPSRDAEKTFTKYNLGLTHKTSLPLNLQASFKLEGQWSYKRLAPQEEFSLGGINSVRGYPSGNFLADDAFQANTELLIPAFLIPKEIKLPYDTSPLRDYITGVAFFDYAYGQRNEVSFMQKRKAALLGAGAGVRIRLAKHGLLRVEWGFPLGGYEPTRGSTDSRLHISLNIEDRVLQELERIYKTIKQKHQ